MEEQKISNFKVGSSRLSRGTMKKLTQKKIKELLSVKEITLKEINDLVWSNSWKGKIDPTALRERLSELLNAERELDFLQSRLRLLKDLFK
jgi:hypothetical protein